MKTKSKSGLIISILIPIAVGAVSAWLSGNMTLFNHINKPPLSPPSFIFPIVWTTLYILMGISSYIIYHKNGTDIGKALITYALQLIFNFFWSIIFFRFEAFLPAFIWLAVMTLLVALMIYRFYKVSHTAAYLQIPYLLWCLFALYLNFMIYHLN